MFRLIIILFTPLLLASCAVSQASVKANSKPEIKIDCFCESDHYNCSDFKTSREAREVYECCKTKVGYDVHRLDRDSDNLACEW